MKLTKLFLALFAGSLLFVSCSDDDTNDMALGAYDNGTFVLNEGNSNPSSASVSFIGKGGVVTSDIFTIENPGAAGTGSYLQDMFMDDTRIFIISGQANKITVVDRYTFKLIATVDTNFNNPRYGAVVNGKAYVTNAADFSTGADDYFTVIELSSYTTTKVPLNNWSEKVIEENGKLYISNGAFGNGTSVTVFNPVNNSIEKVIELGVSPNSLEEEDNVLYVLGGGKISKINILTNEVNATVSLPTGFEDAAHLTIENNKIYFTNTTSVYVMDKNESSAPSAALLTYESTSEFGAMYGFNVNDDTIYISDAGNFSSDSKAYAYSLSGTLLATYTVGVGPNGFYFND